MNKRSSLSNKHDGVGFHIDEMYVLDTVHASQVISCLHLQGTLSV